MKYRWTDLPAILRNPLASQFIREGIRSQAWPVYRLVASVYRCTVSMPRSILTDPNVLRDPLSAAGVTFVDEWTRQKL